MTSQYILTPFNLADALLETSASFFVLFCPCSFLQVHRFVVSSPFLAGLNRIFGNFVLPVKYYRTLCDIYNNG
jgi:hypothetical protein